MGEAALFDIDDFSERLDLLALCVPVKDIGSILKNLSEKGLLFVKPRMKTVVNFGESQSHKLVLLRESLTDRERFPVELNQFLSEHPTVSVVSTFVVLDYDYWTTEHILRKLLPSTVTEIPTSFETIGHIAHMNLKDSLLPFAKSIAKVIMDKNPSIRTVVNKTGEIKNEFRVFPMEVVAGEPTLETEVRQEGCVFRLNFGEVYWNSRLQTEHTRVASLLLPADIVCDMFAGIGPFAIPAAKHGCTVYANDLNPRSAHYCKVNAALNQVEKRVHVSCMDGRAFVRRLAHEGVPFTKVLMNLPAIALEFLDVFIGLDRDLTRPAPQVFCYCFSKAADAVQDVIERASHALRCDLPPSSVTVHDVRNVAPRKQMLCVSFVVPATVLRGEVQEVAGSADSVPDQKRVRLTSEDDGEDDD